MMIRVYHFRKKGYLRNCFALLLLSFWGTLNAQLQPGFSKTEYAELMKISARTTADTGYANRLPPPQQFKMVYRAPVTGLDNRWDLWSDNGGTVAVSIRGTTKKQESWLENFYAAMVPAAGTLQLAGGANFAYKLAAHPDAAVHAGWLIGFASMADDVVQKLDSAVRSGTRNLLIIGHSQGGAIAYLLTAHLRQLQASGRLPSGLRIKTYCSAAPKPGNTQFAYAYERATYGGWAFNVVNSADWVPETPISIQTLGDFNRLNPFAGAKQTIRKMRFPVKLALQHVYNRLYKSPQKAARAYRKYLGKMVGKQVAKKLPGIQLPPYVTSSNYMRTGNQVVLLADSAYFQHFPDTGRNVFRHHLHAAYLYLLEQLPDSDSTALAPHGPLMNTLLLTLIANSKLSGDKKPLLHFDAGATTGIAFFNYFKSPIAIRKRIGI